MRLFREVKTVVYWLIDKKYILQTKEKYPVLHIVNMGSTYQEHLTPRNVRSLVESLDEHFITCERE